MTNYRAELQRLVKAYDDHGGKWLENDVEALHQAVERARATLSQPEPEGLTEWELLDLGNDVMGNPLPCDPDLLLAFARAVIAADRARWGRPAIKPVPVSERLPGEEDCDPSFQCWWFTPSEEKWILWPIKWAGPECSHWLPHHALPVPTFTEAP